MKDKPEAAHAGPLQASTNKQQEKTAVRADSSPAPVRR